MDTFIFMRKSPPDKVQLDCLPKAGWMNNLTPHEKLYSNNKPASLSCSAASFPTLKAIKLTIQIKEVIENAAGMRATIVRRYSYSPRAGERWKDKI